jgi:hypothetical protein
MRVQQVTGVTPARRGLSPDLIAGGTMVQIDAEKIDENGQV